jgi:hypothetical protein
MLNRRRIFDENTKTSSQKFLILPDRVRQHRQINPCGQSYQHNSTRAGGTEDLNKYLQRIFLSCALKIKKPSQGSRDGFKNLPA